MNEARRLSAPRAGSGRLATVFPFDRQFADLTAYHAYSGRFCLIICPYFVLNSIINSSPFGNSAR